jgi:hypothetical protein
VRRRWFLKSVGTGDSPTAHHEGPVGAGPLLCPADLGSVRANDEVDVDGTVEEDMGKSTEGSRTDDIVV